MGTTDNFDSSALATPVGTSTFPVLRASNAGAGNHTLKQVQAFTGNYRVPNLTGSLGTLSSLGTDTAGVNGTVWYTSIFVPFTGVALTGIGVLNGSVVGTDNILAALYDDTGAVVANSALAGALSAGANAFQQLAFTAAYTIVRPGRYFVGVSTNGTTAKIRTVATATWIDILSTSATGTFGTLAALTPPTTFTADKAPIVYLYQ